MRRAPRNDDENGNEGTSSTLGDLLYADKSKTPVSERDWVELVQSIGAGNPRALQALYDRSHRVVFTLAMRITRNREAAEEVTLDVFHDVWRSASKFDAAGGTVVGWLMNRARSRAIDRLRFDQRKKRVPPDVHAPLSTSAPSEPDDAVELKELGRLLQDALTALTPGEREAIEQTFFAESSHAEVAERLSQPVGTIKSRIRNGLTKLRQALNARAKP